MADMDRISQLPDELLLTILSLLPVKNIVVTMVLSKRWKFIWKFVPRLKYEQDGEDKRFSQFVHTSLQLHEAPVIETLNIKVLSQSCDSEESDDSQPWVKGERSVLDLMESEILMGKSFRMLVTLKLRNIDLVNYVSSSSLSFPSLKKMSLKYNIYPSDHEFVNKLLSSASCPVLEDLVFVRCPNDNVAILRIRFPSLKKLFLHNSIYIDCRDDAHGFVIDAPSLECLDILDYSCGCGIIENNMRKIEKADLDSDNLQTRKLLSFLTSAKRFLLCLPIPKDAYPVGNVFYNLVHLTLCICETEWLNLLLCVLRDSPKLQILELEEYHYLRDEEPRPHWKEPSSVPKCLSTSLEIFEWLDYEGAEEEKEVIGYILRNGSCLKKATIFSKSTNEDKKLEITKELLSLWKLSPTCHLTVN